MKMYPLGNFDRAGEGAYRKKFLNGHIQGNSFRSEMCALGNTPRKTVRSLEPAKGPAWRHAIWYGCRPQPFETTFREYLVST
jgi:hypothetical protein